MQLGRAAAAAAAKQPGEQCDASPIPSVRGFIPTKADVLDVGLTAQQIKDEASNLRSSLIMYHFSDFRKKKKKKQKFCV